MRNIAGRRRRQPAAALTWLLTVALATTTAASPCPTVNKQGFRPGAVVRYTVRPSPDGTPFPPALVPCVRRAFDAWTHANRRSGLEVRFEPGDGGIEVHVDKPGGLLLSDRTGGAWSNAVRAADGFLERAHIWLTSDPSLVDECLGITKVTLHELGHLHGLADRPIDRGRSVMNRAVRRNDRNGRIPLGPTPCDAARARAASMEITDAGQVTRPPDPPEPSASPAPSSPSTATSSRRPPPPPA